jgi:NitT/TauT family transport system substrate-binding protein
MALIQTRRRFLAGLSGIGASKLLPLPALAAGGALETTSVRLPKAGICSAPIHVVTDLLRDEGFTKIDRVPLPQDLNVPDLIARREIDFGLNYAHALVAGIDHGVEMKILVGVHVGCFEVFVNGAIRGVAELAGKKVGVSAIGSAEHLFLSLVAANVGIDPGAQIDWVASGPVHPKELFVDGKIDAFLGQPPVPQELRVKGIGRVVVNSTVDRPWSQYLCCMLAGSADYVENHPVATKRVVRAILKATDLCATEPARAARALVDNGFTPRYDYALQALQELPYDKWREYDHEDTVRFYSLRLRDVGFIKSSPQKIITDGSDWRFLNELKRELKA